MAVTNLLQWNLKLINSVQSVEKLELVWFLERRKQRESTKYTKTAWGKCWLLSNSSPGLEHVGKWSRKGVRLVILSLGIICDFTYGANSKFPSRSRRLSKTIGCPDNTKHLNPHSELSGHQMYRAASGTYYSGLCIPWMNTNCVAKSNFVEPSSISSKKTMQKWLKYRILSSF